MQLATNNLLFKEAYCSNKEITRYDILYAVSKGVLYSYDMFLGQFEEEIDMEGFDYCEMSIAELKLLSEMKIKVSFNVFPNIWIDADDVANEIIEGVIRYLRDKFSINLISISFFNTNLSMEEKFNLQKKYLSATNFYGKKLELIFEE